MNTEQTEAVHPMLKPRLKVVADYPNSPYKIGEFITFDTQSKVLTNLNFFNEFGEFETVANMAQMEVFETYPTLFVKAYWWEGVEPEDMPEYLKRIGKGMRKVKYDFDNGVLYLVVPDGLVPLTLKLALPRFLPATREEYEAQENENQ